MRLTRINGDVLLTVTDNGRASDSAEPAAAGLGLINMRERARQLHGTFAFNSKPGRGTTVSVRIPFRRREGMS